MSNASKKQEIINQIIFKITGDFPSYAPDKLESLKKNLEKYSFSQLKRCVNLFNKHSVSEAISMFGLEDKNGKEKC